MPSLTVNDLPEHLYLALKTAASRAHRSLSQQALIALARGLDIPLDVRARREEVFAEIKRNQPRLQKWAQVDFTRWVREDRDTR